MKFVDHGPREIREIENLWIPMPDGVKLAARVWLPVDAERDPVPAVLEYLPYRKRDGTVRRDEILHAYVARQGYAVIRLDMRGTGESEGLIFDEYTVQEQDDGVAALAWIAAQPWCSGNTGMIGISWSGFNGLQIAARRPPSLKAIVTLCSTDDRYADDVHYVGGGLNGENVAWGAAMNAFTSLPPDPLLVGESWREMWLERLNNMPNWVEPWLRHQRRDAYWRHGSVCENFAEIECAVYAIGGWADGYSNAVPRLLAGLKCPRKGLIGPWSHAWPHGAGPGPQIGFAQETVRWWDHWLKRHPNGIMDEPCYRVWMQEFVAPAAYHPVRPGRWVAEASWPSSRISMQAFHLGDGILSAALSPGVTLSHTSPQTVGSCGGTWCGHASRTDSDSDQRSDDGASLVFDTAPLTAPLEILGAAVLEIDVTADRPQALLVARLCEVAPNGQSLRVTYGILNLSHRDGHAEPKPLQPGKRYRVQIRLNDAAHRFAAGNRIRLAISTAYWPIVWPSPAAATLSIDTAESRVLLPVRAHSVDDGRLRNFDPAEGASPGPIQVIAPSIHTRQMANDIHTGQQSLNVANADGEILFERIDLAVGAWNAERYRIAADDPLSAVAEFDWIHTLKRGDWSIRTEIRAEISADADTLHHRLRLYAYEGEVLILDRAWELAIPRDNI